MFFLTVNDKVIQTVLQSGLLIFYCYQGLKILSQEAKWCFRLKCQLNTLHDIYSGFPEFTSK